MCDWITQRFNYCHCWYNSSLTPAYDLPPTEAMQIKNKIKISKILILHINKSSLEEIKGIAM